MTPNLWLARSGGLLIYLKYSHAVLLCKRPLLQGEYCSRVACTKSDLQHLHDRRYGVKLAKDKMLACLAFVIPTKFLGMIC